MCKFGFSGPDMKDIIESQYEGTRDYYVESLWDMAEEYEDEDWEEDELYAR